MLRKRKTVKPQLQKPIEENGGLQYIPYPFADGPMRSFDRYVNQVFARTLLLIVAVAGVFLLAGHRPLARGVVLGGAASLVNLVVMAGDVRRQGAKAGDRGMSPSYGSYALRMAVIIAVLIYSAITIKIVFWATVPALFASQLVMTGGELLERNKQEPS